VIDAATEKLIGLAAAARMVPAVDGEGAVTAKTVGRWAKKGIRSPGGLTVRLEVIRLGRRILTSREAVRRFFEKLQQQPADVLPIRGPAERARASEASEAELSMLGA
jgi:hypothetical protein